MDGTRLIRQDAALVVKTFGAASGLVAALFVSLALVGALGGVSVKELIPGLRLGEPRVEALASEPLAVPAATHVVAAPAPVVARPSAVPVSKPVAIDSTPSIPIPVTPPAVPASEPTLSSVPSPEPILAPVVRTVGGLVGGLLGGLLGR